MLLEQHISIAEQSSCNEVPHADAALPLPPPPAPFCPCPCSFHPLLLLYRLYVFEGAVVKADGSRDALDVANLLLRGCTLRNTDWVIGLVLFAGLDTKIFRNRVRAPRKVWLSASHTLYQTDKGRHWRHPVRFHHRIRQLIECGSHRQDSQDRCRHSAWFVTFLHICNRSTLLTCKVWHVKLAMTCHCKCVVARQARFGAHCLEGALVAECTMVPFPSSANQSTFALHTGPTKLFFLLRRRTFPKSKGSRSNHQ